MSSHKINSLDTPLPQTIDPVKLAGQQVDLAGTVDLGSLTRFRDMLYEPSGSAEVELHFGADPEKRRIVSGRLKASVVLQCQRCMQGMQTTLTSDFRLGLVISDEQAKQLPRELEPVLIDDSSADLWQMVEDELLLVVPPYPVHERTECPATETLEAYEPSDEDQEESVSAERENPFDVLAGLKTKNRH